MKVGYVQQNNRFTPQNNQKNHKQQTQPNFTGWVDMTLRFLDTNQAWGANAVDLGFMVTPRTITDFTRGPEAGIETARREGFGTANHSSIGLYGTVAGMALATGLNKAYSLNKGDVKYSSIFADSETLDLHGGIYHEKVNAAKTNTSINPLREYLSETLKSYEALSPDENAKWIKLENTQNGKNTIEKVVNILENEINNSTTNKISKDGALNARAELISAFGAENNLRIIAKEGERQHSSRYTVDSIIENLYKLGKTFSKENIKETFLNSQNFESNAFIKMLKPMNLKRSLVGIGIASAVGISAQPFNMYLTKKTTGKSGFVGGGEADNTTGFKIKKALVAGLFGAGVLATIGNPKHLVKNLQFKGLSPTINQFKFIYGITIMSRFLSSRNDNELKESSIKDTLGFVNWLLLGNFVQKLVAQKLDSSLIKKDGNGVLNWIKNSVLKTRDEVLYSDLGEKAFKNGKALKYEEMLEIASKGAKTKIRNLTIAQLVGYAYSGLVLGFGIPKLNIYLTKRRMEAQQKVQNEKPSNEDMMLKPTNRAFLSSQHNFTGLK